MRIFRLEGFEPGRSLTVLHRGPVFGRVAMTYAVAPGPEGSEGSRLLMRIRCAPPAVPVAATRSPRRSRSATS